MVSLVRKRHRWYVTWKRDNFAETSERAAAMRTDLMHALLRSRHGMMAMLGHDLRAPLHAIQMAAAVLQNGGAPAPMGRRIQTSSDRMSCLISQVC